MGRPRTFDTEIAAAQALEAFWTRGYSATSVDDLCKATGLSRSSIYETFGSKHGVWLAAMDLYQQRSVVRLAELLRQTRPVQAAVETFLMMFVDNAVAGPGRRGCFLGNCTGELATADPVSAARLAQGFAAFEAVMYEALRDGQAAGELAPDTDVRALARFLMSTVQGLRLVAKAKPDRGLLTDIVRGAMGAFR
jgi:TetR/AcrR family transcriptional repressor of nem operon